MKKLQRRFFIILLLLSLARTCYYRYVLHQIQMMDDAILEQEQQLRETVSNIIIVSNISVVRQPAYYRARQYATAEENNSLSLINNNVDTADEEAEEVAKKKKTAAAVVVTYSDLIQRSMGLPSYTMKQVTDAAKTFTAQYAIVVYDPVQDTFIGYYSQRHQWGADTTTKKLISTITTLTWLLRKLFPTRFHPEMPEFVLALSGGDYPAVRDRGCIRNFDEQIGPCGGDGEGEREDDYKQQQQGKGRNNNKYNNNNSNSNNKAPILHFGSVYRGPLFPNLIAMPMPGVHLNCFTDWFTSRNICRHFLPSYLNVKPGGLVFGEDVGLSWDDLIPQLVWRGTDFPFLEMQNDLVQPSFEEYVGDTKIIDDVVVVVEDHRNPMEVVTAILREKYDRLVPRWKAVVLSAESEIEARQTNTMPKLNIKFSHVAGDIMGDGRSSKRKRLAQGSTEYQDWERIGFPVAGEVLPPRELAKYKYHIDLGGGGGTTWGGTFEKLSFPGLLFHHVTPTKDYIHDLIEPYVHYVPVKSDLSDLMQKLEWAESHPNYARQISENASKFMRELGTTDGFERVFQNNMVKPLRRVIEAYTPLDPTNEQHHGAFRQELTKNVGFNWRKPFMRCSGQSRFSCKLIGDWGMK